jgi:hypothetical protein
MKYPVFVVLLLLAGCASRSSTTVEHAQSQKVENPTGESRIASLTSKADAHLAWNKIENLTGEPLVDSLISDGDIDLAELKERRRNVRLEIATWTTELKGNTTQEQLEWDLTRKLHTEALERKMALWKAVQKE